MDRAGFSLHDVSAFPIVRLRGKGLPPGYAPAWAAEMEALLRQGTPFALVFLDGVEDETHDDRKARTLWLKENRAALAALCRGIVSVEPDKVKRIAKRAQAFVVAKAFDLHIAMAADATEAEAIARRLLAGEAVRDADE